MSVPQNIKIIAATWLDSSQDVEAIELVELLDWVRTQMRIEVAKYHDIISFIDQRRAASGKEPISHPSFGADELVINIAIELDLAPWETKEQLTEEDLAPARLLCRAAGFADVEDHHEVITLRSKLEQTEAQRGNACAWALLYKRRSEGRPEPEGVRGTPRPLSLVLDDNSLAEAPNTVTLAQWRDRALKAESTLAEIRQTSMGQVLGLTQELMSTLIGMLDPVRHLGGAK